MFGFRSNKITGKNKIPGDSNAQNDSMNNEELLEMIKSKLNSTIEEENVVDFKEDKLLNQQNTSIGEEESEEEELSYQDEKEESEEEEELSYQDEEEEKYDYKSEQLKMLDRENYNPNNNKSNDNISSVIKELVQTVKEVKKYNNNDNDLNLKKIVTDVVEEKVLEWLDQNLGQIVNKIVRDEISKVVQKAEEN